MRKITKIMAVLLVLTMLVSAFGTTIFAANDDWLLGDMNRNSKIEISDARKILRIAVDIEDNVTAEMELLADFNADSKVTISDARLVLRVAVGIDTHPDIDDSGTIGSPSTKTALLETYTTLMNKAKEEKPAFSMYSYLTMPNNSTDRVIKKGGINNISSDRVYDIFDNLNILSSESEAMKKMLDYEKGSDMKAFPVIDNDSGCLLKDASLIKSAEYVPLVNGNAQITIVLKDEKEPKDRSNGKINSTTGLMFNHMTKSSIDELLEKPSFSTWIKNYDYTRTYHDCKVIIEYDKITNEIVSLEQVVVASVEFTGTVIGLLSVELVQNFYNTTKYVNFDYPDENPVVVPSDE